MIDCYMYIDSPIYDPGYTGKIVIDYVILPDPL